MDFERHLQLVTSHSDAPLEFTERRYHPPSGPGAPVVTCRVCFTRPTLAPQRIEVYEGRAYHRCPTCNGVSLIRLGDPVVIGWPYGSSQEKPEPGVREGLNGPQDLCLDLAVSCEPVR